MPEALRVVPLPVHHSAKPLQDRFRHQARSAKMAAIPRSLRIQQITRYMEHLLVIIVVAMVILVAAAVQYSCIPEQPHSEETYLNVADQLREHYQQAQPFPHVIVDNFFPENLIRAVEGAFPNYRDGFHGSVDDGFAVSKVNSQFLKVERMVPVIHPAARFLMDHMKSSEFIWFLEALTGIDNLIPDPHSYGSGLHHTVRGGHLGVHLDYNYHPVLKMWRRINVFVYLNEGWQEEWKGDLEFWSEDQSELLLAIAPLFNRLVIFEASEHSWHGHPDPLNCPPEMARKSIAMYYYTVADNPSWARQPRCTLFMPRRGIDDWLPEQRYEQATH